MVVRQREREPACKMCRQRPARAKSHIIARAQVFDICGKTEPIGMYSQDAQERAKRRQSGPWDRTILCHECEARYQLLDKHATEAMRVEPVPWLQNGISMLPDAHAATLKLYFMHVLWRAHESQLPDMVGIDLREVGRAHRFLSEPLDVITPSDSLKFDCSQLGQFKIQPSIDAQYLPQTTGIVEVLMVNKDTGHRYEAYVGSHTGSTPMLPRGPYIMICAAYPGWYALQDVELSHAVEVVSVKMQPMILVEGKAEVAGSAVAAALIRPMASSGANWCWSVTDSAGGFQIYVPPWVSDSLDCTVYLSSGTTKHITLGRDGAISWPQVEGGK